MAQIQSLAWELPFATSAAIKFKKQELALTKNQILINRYINATKRKCKFLETHQKAIEKLKKEGRLSEAELSKIGDQNAIPFEKGIIDPTKVVRTAVVGAVKIASMMLTTEAMIVDEVKKEDKKQVKGEMEE